jgi:hypothetical protein
MGWTAGVCFRAEARNLSLFHSVQIGCEAHSTSYPIGIGGYLRGVKRPDSETDYSPPTSAEIKTRLHGLLLN